MAEKVINNIKSVEKSLFDEIQRLQKSIVYDTASFNLKHSYFESLNLIGKYFEFIFDNVENLEIQQAIICNFISKNLIDDFYFILNKLYGNGELWEEIHGRVDSNLSQFIVILKVLARCCEKNREFGNEICKRENLIQYFVKIINEYEFSINETISKGNMEILELSIRNLYSTVLHDSEINIHQLQKLKVLESIKNHEKCTNEKIKTRFILLAAYVSEEKDSSGFINDISSLSIIIQLLSDSMKRNEDCQQEFTTYELLKAIEKLSKFDKNKRTLVEMGFLSILKELLTTNCTKYQQISLLILWNLAFDERNKSEITEKFLDTISKMTNLEILKTNEQISVSDLNNTVDKSESTNKMKSVYEGIEPNMKINRKVGNESYFESPSKEIVQNKLLSNNSTVFENNSASVSQKLNALLWILKSNEKEKMSSPIDNSHKIPSVCQKHVMISYCHEDENFALKLYDDLKARDFKLWIDKYDITANQNLMEEMAQAVEQSLAVILCISHCYKSSVSCRAEAQYAKDNKKPLIPLMIQKEYRPDGWLGLCITGIQYLNFSGKYTFEESMAMLTKQLKQFNQENQKSNKPLIITDHSKSLKYDNNQSNDIKVSNWSNSKVINWFHQIGIQKFVWKNHYTGSELEFLKSISSEKLLEFCHSELEMDDLKDIRILSEELKKL